MMLDMFRSKSTPRFDTRDLHPRVRREGESSRLVNQTLASLEGQRGREGGREEKVTGRELMLDIHDYHLVFLANSEEANGIKLGRPIGFIRTGGSHMVCSKGRQTGRFLRPFLACSLWLSLQTICPAREREKERQNREMMATLELGCHLSEEGKPS